MIYTARQLQEMHKSNGHVVLPAGARLSPLAADWARAKKIQVGYGEATGARAGEAKQEVKGTGVYLWWCDGPCGPAKAALAEQERQGTVRAMDGVNETRHAVEVVKQTAREVKQGSASGAVLVVQSAAEVMVYANRCPGLRAVLGTGLEAVERGISEVAANVLVIEHPRATLMQVKNMVGRFVRGTRTANEELKRRLEEVASCG